MLSHTKKLIGLFCLALTVSFHLFASGIPRGCQVIGFGYQNNFLILNDRNAQTFFLIQNRSNRMIELEHHETKEVFMSPKLRSKLEPSRWAAFAADEPNLHFMCSTQEGNDTVRVNCSDVLEVCQYPRVKFALSNMGNYWVSTNKDQGQVIKDAVAKGILLRW